MVAQIHQFIARYKYIESYTGTNYSKIQPITDHKGTEGQQRHSSTHTQLRRLEGCGLSTSRPGHFAFWKKPGTHCTEAAWTGPPNYAPHGVR